MLSTNPDPICHRSTSRRKRPIEVVPHASKLRSTIPRRRRIPLHPIVDGSSNDPFDAEGEAESASSCLGSAISSESSLVFAGSGALKRTRSPCQRVWNSAEIGRVSPENEFRRITRAYARRRERLRSPECKEDGGRKVGLGSTKRSKIEENTRHATVETSVSEVSGGFPDENLKNGDVASKTVEIDPEITQTSCLESVSDAIAAKIPKSASEEGRRSQFSQNFASRGEEPRDQDLDSDLVCSEEFSSRDRGSSEYSTCSKTTLSELEAELFARSSEGDSSEYSLSVLADSSSDDLSEKSCENSAPSATFSLFLQFSQQFSRSNSSSESSSSPGIREDSPQEFTLTRFEEEDEESYKRFRSRESMEAVLRDYAEEYSSSTDYGDLILEQRLQMVNWIVEHSNAMELQGETLFLGVSLMDRFLSRGYFRTERNLQLLGIACVTLATRLEENQPYNSIRQKCFKVGNNVYTRSEVVAMEWLVQEVLKFQCFLPTIHHFLWFYLKAAGADTNVENLSRYLAVLSLLDHERLCFKPSTVAAGLVILACLATNNDSSCLTVMETHVRTKNDDLPECIQSLEWLVKYVC